MRVSKLVIGLAALVLAPAACLAAAENGGRYTMSPTEDGVVRLDTMTGAMALCTRTANHWACEDMSDSQQLLMREIEKLQAKNKSLQDQVDQLEETLGLGENQADAPKPGTQFALPNEADVDKAFDYLESMLKKLHERMEKLQKEHGQDNGRAL
jgi:chaperonin cofactor prefoldin